VSAVYFRKAIEFAPDLFLAYHNLALVQYDLGDFDDAAQTFQKAIELSKDPSLVPASACSWFSTSGASLPGPNA
jgi:tetratricopeptide (TPR) repeat protein